MNWPFVHPGFAAFAFAAAAIPVVIHLVNRRRYKRVVWAAMPFLLAAGKTSVRRRRIEQWMLLVLRALLIGMFCLALARPFFQNTVFASVSGTRMHHVILLDNSASMAALKGSGGSGPVQTRFDEASGRVESFLERIGSRDGVSVVTTAMPAAELLGEATYDRRRISDVLQEIKLTQRAGDWAGAFRLAGAVLSASDSAPGNQSLHLFTDVQATELKGLGVDAIEDAIGDGVGGRRRVVMIHDVGGPGSDSGNLAVVGLASMTALTGTEIPSRLSARVANFSSATSRGLSLRVYGNDQLLRTMTVSDVPVGGEREVSFSLQFSSQGTQAVRVALDGADSDALSIDDDRVYSVEVLEAMPLLAVDGVAGQRDGAITGSVDYLVTALSAGGRGSRSGLFDVKTITDIELSTEVLNEYRVIVLSNLRRLDDGTWSRLREYVEQGGGLLVFPGDQVLAARQGSAHSWQSGGPLPVSLDEVIELPAGEDLGFAYEDFSHPLMAEFSGAPDISLFRVRGRRMMRVSYDPAVAAVPLRYENGEPAIVVAAMGQGRVAYVNTSADMSWSNLPAKGDFVSLMHNLVSYLSGGEGRRRNVAVGESVVVGLSARESSLEITALPCRVARETGGDGMTLRVGPLEEAGVCTVSIGGRATHFAGQLAERESDLRQADQDMLAEKFGDRFEIVAQEQLDSRSGLRTSAETGGWMLAAVFLLLMGEVWLATRVGAS
jgi:uncharacterized membrane protein